MKVHKRTASAATTTPAPKARRTHHEERARLQNAGDLFAELSYTTEHAADMDEEDIDELVLIISSSKSFEEWCPYSSSETILQDARDLYEYIDENLRATARKGKNSWTMLIYRNSCSDFIADGENVCRSFKKFADNYNSQIADAQWDYSKYSVSVIQKARSKLYSLYREQAERAIDILIDGWEKRAPRIKVQKSDRCLQLYFCW